MALKNYDELNSIQMDALREIGNIGSGNAATSLSTMLSQKINIAVPKIKVLDYTEVASALGGPESMIVGTLLMLTGDVTGIMMFLLQKEFAHNTLNALLGEAYIDFSSIDELGYSALQEIANIMAASYVNSVALLTGLNINISPPEICTDMVGAILSVPAIYYANISDKIIFIEDEFNMKNESMCSHLLMIPDVESLTKMMSALGIEI